MTLQEKSLSLLALEGYCDLVSAICIHFPRQLEDFLTASAVSDAPDFQQKIIRLIRNFQVGKRSSAGAGAVTLP